MEMLKIKNLKYNYPSSDTIALSVGDLSVKEGELCCLFGASGSGKSTLLNLLVGKIEATIGSVLVDAANIGYVGQNPELQIVCDKVWHELAFALESQGASQNEIRIAVSEAASFFGLEDIFYSDTATLSGGQKQLINLASVMTTKPSLLLLDEPTSQLDPIAADEFISTIKKINDEFGTTIIISEHRLDDLLHLSDSVILLNNGNFINKVTPRQLPGLINDVCPNLLCALPAPMQVFSSFTDRVPLNVKEGRRVLGEFEINPLSVPSYFNDNEIVVSVDKVYARYERELPDVLKNISLKVRKGEIVCVLGGNGSGKSSLLSCIQGNLKHYRGKVSTIGDIVTLPQNPRFLFSKKSVYLDFLDVCNDDAKVLSLSKQFGVEQLLNKHPFDLSGGELQRCAFVKLMLCGGDVFLLDEPTKGLDSAFKLELISIIRSLSKRGKTFIIVSHDVDFLANVSHRCGLLFDGQITSVAEPHEFFSNNNFYTTSTNKLFRGFENSVITIPEGIFAISGVQSNNQSDLNLDGLDELDNITINTAKPGIKPVLTIALSLIFLVSLIFGFILKQQNTVFGTIALVSFTGGILINSGRSDMNVYVTKRKELSLGSKVIALISVVLIICTIVFGATILSDKKYYFISLLIILEAMVPFVMLFEHSKPTSREVVTIAVLSALAVGGRLAFYFIPNFKPQLAIIMLTGVTLGGEVGFICGVVSAFVSNMFFGQGAWTPWQMFAFGICGYLSGVMFCYGRLKVNRFLLSLFGFAYAFVIYGGIMDTATVFMLQAQTLSINMLLLTYASGVKFNLIHAASTAFFLWALGPMFIERINHLRIKYKMF